MSDFVRRELPYKAFFDHEGGKGAEAAMALGAAVGDVAAALDHVKTLCQCAFAAWAGQFVTQGAHVVVAVVVQKPKQVDNRSRRELQVFLGVKPDATAEVTQVKLDRAAGHAGQRVGVHGGLTRGALGGRWHGFGGA